MCILENELHHQLNQKEGYVEDIRRDMESKLCQLQLENVTLNKTKQQFDMEMKRLNIDLKSAAEASLSERKRLEDEIAGLRARLDSTQNMLTSSRQEALGIAEAKSGLDRELNIIREQTGLPILPNLDYIPAKEINYENVSSVNLKELCKKQTHIIDELKSQCLMATDKLEALSKKYQKEKAQYEYSLDVLMRQIGDKGLPNFTNKNNLNLGATAAADDNNTAVIEWLCRRLGSISILHDIVFKKSMI